MQRYLQKQIKALVEHGVATDVTNASSIDAIPEPYREIAYSVGVYGINGRLFKGERTKNLYAIVGRASSIYLF